MDVNQTYCSNYFTTYTCIKPLCGTTKIQCYMSHVSIFLKYYYLNKFPWDLSPVPCCGELSKVGRVKVMHQIPPLAAVSLVLGKTPEALPGGAFSKLGQNYWTSQKAERFFLPKQEPGRAAWRQLATATSPIHHFLSMPAHGLHKMKVC